MHTLIRLRGPLQAWSNTAEARTKTTWEFPTKAGVLGIIASAMGILRGSIEEQQFLKTSQKWKTITFSGFTKTRDNRPVVGKPQLVLDYHTIGKPDSPLPGATTKYHPGTPRTKMYLADADFVVAIQTTDQEATLLKQALTNPQWPPFLGRKHCVPSTPLLILQTEEIPEFVTHGLEELNLSKGTKLTETESSKNAIELFDVPTTFSPSRKAYGHRFVTKEIT